MAELPPTTDRKPTDPDEPDRTTDHFLHSGSSDDVEPGTVIAGKYKLLAPIGEGGMGSVWLAQQFEPVKRQVAIKLIRAGMDSKTILARFEAERQALSMMDHPNIARVLDAGTTANGRPFFAMELVKGTPITEFCDERKLTPRQRLELFVPVCNAIQHAHQKGIIHRDIKPSNVLVALHDDKPVPKVIDFGVAKATGFTLTEKTLHTGFEQVVGTPVYMSPEQATFNQLDIDTRSDVYSLGVLLYELLTGTTPIERERFKKAALLEMLRIVREEEPPRPSARLSSIQTKATIAELRGTEPVRLGKELRTELDWVVMKSLEKDRTRRYSTAVNFAEEVQRYLTGEAVQAHPPSAGYRLRKFVRRHRGPAIAASLIFLALIGGAVGAIYGVVKADGEREANQLRMLAEQERDLKELARGTAVALQLEAESERNRARRAEAEVRFLNYAHAVDLSHREYLANNVPRALELLETCPAELRHWEWHYVYRKCNPHLLLLGGKEAGLTHAVFSPDSNLIALPAVDGTVSLCDSHSGLKLRSLVGHRGAVRFARFSPDARKLLSGGDDLTIRLWDVESGRSLHVFEGHSKYIKQWAFSPSGRWIVTVSDDRTAMVWDVESRTRRWRFEAPGNQWLSDFVGAGFVDDESQIVIAHMNNTVQVRDMSNGTLIKELKGPPLSVKVLPSVHHWTAAFSKAGRDLATTWIDGWVRVWNTGTGKVVPIKGEFHNVAFSPDGSRLATTSLNGTGAIWDAMSGKLLNTLLGHEHMVTYASFSPDGKSIVTSSVDRTARVWDVATGLPLATLKGHTAPVQSADYSRDGRRILTFSVDGTARTWDIESMLRPAIRIEGSLGLKPSPAFSSDRTLIVTLWDKTPAVWNAANGKLMAKGPRNDDAYGASIAPDGKRVVTASNDKTASVWSIGSEKADSILSGHDDAVISARFSHDGSRILTTSSDKSARLWDAGNGKELERYGGHSTMVTSAAFAPDDRSICTGCMDGTMHIWKVSPSARHRDLVGHTASINSISYFPDGGRIATASGDFTARIWQAETGKPLVVLRGHYGSVNSAEFSRDGRRLLTSSDDRTIRLWDTESGKLLLTMDGTMESQAVFGVDQLVAHFAGTVSIIPPGHRTLRLDRLDVRPNGESFRKYLEAPPPRTKP